MTTRVYLIRHAQSFPSAKLPEPRWPLSARGEQQASQLATLLDPLGLSTLYSSPYLRCMRTIGPFAERAGLNVTTDAELRERRIATSVRADFDELWQRSWDDFSFALPGCESSLQAQERFVAAVSRLLEQAQDPVGICAHGNVIGLLLNQLDPSFGVDRASRLRNPDVVALDLLNGRLSWDHAYELGGISEIATDSGDTPIDW